MPDVPLPFVSENQAASATRPEDFPLPVREDNLVTPLLLSAAMYPDLERLVLGALTSVYLAFRVFDPETRTR